MILKNKGVLGLITSDTWLNLDSFRNLRKIVSRSNQLVKVVTLRNPFKKVSVSPVIFVVCKGKVNDYNFGVEKLDITSKHVEKQKIIPSDSILHPAYIIDLSITIESSKLLKKIESKSTPLVKLSRLQYGIMTANNKRFITAEAKGECCKPLLAGEDIKRYYINWHGDRYIDYQPREMKKKKTARPGEPERFEQEEKIVFQRYSSTKVIASLDTKKFYTLGTTIISHTTSLYSNRYILGVINSHLLNWWYSRCYTSPTNYIREFEQLPIREIDFDKTDDKAKHDKMVKLVERMLDLHKKLSATKIPDEKIKIQRRINAADKQIDQLVYQLYNLTPQEIAIVERS